ncbi:MAG: DNA repair protein RecO [Bacilli bacterium]
MKIICVEGIVMSETNYSETSKILNVYTKELGIIGIMSKGCRSLKSKLRSVSGKLIMGKFNIYYKENSLSILISVDVLNSYLEIRKDINKISYASYLLDLTTQVFKQSNSEEIFELLINGLEKINNNIDALVITNIIEIKMLEYLGVLPIIDSCSKCGNDKLIKTISVLDGGYICQNCYDGEYIYDEKAIKLIRMFYLVDLKNVNKIDISDKIKKQLNKFIKEYYEEYTGLYLKTKKLVSILDNNLSS